jgi:stage IV sporulation protein FB
MGMNLALFAFNLVPAFPMDGGRIFRSFLAFWMERHKATRIASIVGQLFALGFIIWGLYNGQYILAVIGVFIILSAGGESKSTKLQYLLKQAKVADIVRKRFTPIHTYDVMQTPIDALKHNNEKSFLVFNPQEVLTGVIIAPAMDFVFKENKIHDEVLRYMHPLPTAVSPNLALKDLYEMMTKQKLFILPVVEEGKLIGLVDREQLQNWINLSMPKSGLRRFVN